jgi:hypothetical protein
MHALLVLLLKIYIMFTYFIPLIFLGIIDFWLYRDDKLAQGLVILPPIVIAATNTIFAAHCGNEYLPSLLLSPLMQYIYIGVASFILLSSFVVESHGGTSDRLCVQALLIHFVRHF